MCVCDYCCAQGVRDEGTGVRSLSVGRSIDRMDRLGDDDTTVERNQQRHNEARAWDARVWGTGAALAKNEPTRKETKRKKKHAHKVRTKKQLLSRRARAREEFCGGLLDSHPLTLTPTPTRPHDDAPPPEAAQLADVGLLLGIAASAPRLAVCLLAAPDARLGACRITSGELGITTTTIETQSKSMHTHTHTDVGAGRCLGVGRRRRRQAGRRAFR
jgi:hypothetical protein